MKLNKKRRNVVSFRRVRKHRMFKKPTRPLFTRSDADLSPILRHWRNQGYQAGRSAALSRVRAPKLRDFKREMNDAWVSWSQLQPELTELGCYVQASQGYVYGYSRARKKRVRNGMLLPTARTVGAVVSTCNGEASIEKLLEQVKRLSFHELIVIVHGSDDLTLEKARKHSPALILHDPVCIGRDAVREISAEMSQSDILLIIDGTSLVTAEMLISILQHLERGADLAVIVPIVTGEVGVISR